MVGSIQAIPICCHMNLYSPTLTPNFDLPWPLRPSCDLLDIFFQLQNIQLNRFINDTPWYMAKTCATGFQNLGCYAAKTAFYFIEEPIVLRNTSQPDSHAKIFIRSAKGQCLIALWVRLMRAISRKLMRRKICKP